MEAGCPRCGADIPVRARFCPACGLGIDQADRRDERKLVTIVFADLVGSTDLAETRDAEQVALILGRYAAVMAEALEAWGGSVEKYIGDAVVGAFGVPTVHEDDAVRAVHAAAEMLRRLVDLNAELVRDHGVRLAIRAGINTGDVLAATAGRLDQRFLAGDAVNVAARLEQAAGAGEVLVAERTVESTLGVFDYDTSIELEVKGRRSAVRARRLMRARPEALAGDDRQVPMRGRQVELERVEKLLVTAAQSSGLRQALIFGPAGIGKSRLVAEAVTAGRTRFPGLRVLRGRCRSSGSGITLWALGEIVRGAIGTTLDDPPDISARRLAEVVRELWPSGGPDHLRAAEDTLFALAVSAGIRLPDNPLARMRPIVVADALREAWPRFLTAYARTGPTIFVVEDLHWADPTLLTVLEAIGRRAEGPLLLLATARPEFIQEGRVIKVHEGRGVTIVLGPLDRADERRIVADMLRWEELPGTLESSLLDRAEGNPFFLQQLVDGLVDEGTLVHAPEGWRLTRDAGAVRLPDTVQGVLGARIDHLPAPQKLVLQEAAIVGRTFWPSAVGQSVDSVSSPLEGLVATGLVVARATSSLNGEVEFGFKHALVRDVAYLGIPLARRARSHARVAIWLESRMAADDGSTVELVAHHYRLALLGDGADLAWVRDPEMRDDVRGRAFRSLLAAGASARQRYATDRALELHEAARALAIHQRELAEVLEELGDDHGWSYHGEPAVDAWRLALDAWRDLGDDEAVARVCVKAARHLAIYWGGFATRPSGEAIDSLVDQGLAHGREPSIRAWLLALRALASSAYAALGTADPRSLPDRMRAAAEAARIATTAGDGDLEVLASRSLCGMFLLAERPDRALARADGILAMSDRIVARRDRLLNVSLALCQVMDIGGDLERALRLARDVHAGSVRESAHERMHATYFVLACLYRLGRWEDALPFASEHLAAFGEETVDMDCPFTRSGPAVAAIVFERLDRHVDAASAEAAIVPNDSRPGLVEAWMAERSCGGAMRPVRDRSSNGSWRSAAERRSRSPSTSCRCWPMRSSSKVIGMAWLG